MDPESVSAGGFLYSDGMSGGTGLVFVPPWAVFPRPRRPRRKRSMYRPVPDTLEDVPTLQGPDTGFLSCQPPPAEPGGV